MKKSIGAKTLVYPTPTWVVGTYDKEDKPNAATVAWGGICCSEPPCIAISLRKATYSYGNIVQRKAFTVNVPSETHVKQADFFGLFKGDQQRGLLASPYHLDLVVSLVALQSRHPFNTQNNPRAFLRVNHRVASFKYHLSLSSYPFNLT